MTPAQLELITAAVDGELSPTETRGLNHLLSTSAEARTLYAKLQANRDRVRALPRVAPPADLKAKVMTCVAALAPAPRVKPKSIIQPVPVRSRSGGVLAWVPLALAASVFLCMAVASFMYFSNQGGSPSVAKDNGPGAELPPHTGTPSTIPSPIDPRPDRPNPGTIVQNDPSVPSAPAPHAPAPTEVAIAPEPRSTTPDLIGFPLVPKLPPFERVEVRVPFLRSATDLGREDVTQELLNELRRDPDPVFKFDLFVRDTARGAEVFQNAAKASGLTVSADSATLEKLKKKQAHAVVIYTESLTAAELTALFAKLSSEDAKFSPKVCDSLHAGPVVRSDELELKAILGADMGLFKRAGQGGDKMHDKSDPKHVSAGTIDSVVKSVTTPSANVKPGEKHAVLLTWQTTHATIGRTNPTQSTELKHYLSKRGNRKPNAVPAIIVIRSVG
ncbi:hypothetical protein VT84_19085 [Gemmata sp. SH-PL17]|uniref:anti-sigma factor family protein n=1 Tax=Gemmata sp. SH-PL17 TaxID=1630693 RepID=UPI00078D02A0|nr:hypothetical protein [Gemmata sp. SH-PL17]AMV26512.1 hypothetical protein VT84_19085 [Gemmata sp. SH-PL17]